MTTGTPQTVPASIPATMHAVRLHEYGGPENLLFEEVPVPEPGDQEVLVQVYAAGINPFDFKLRAGALKEMIPLQFPAILGADISGVVVKAGPGVTYLKPGDAIYGAAQMGRAGGYAEYALSKAGEIAHRPRTLTWVQAAAIPTIAQTAWQSLHNAAEIKSSDKVLIHGAAGSVGMMAVQFAHRAGCHVIAATNAKYTGLMHELGAISVIDYDQAPFEQMAHDVDVVLDTLGGEMQNRSYHTMKPGGILVSLIGIVNPDLADKLNVRAQAFQMQPSALQLDDIAKMLDAGELRYDIAEVAPLSDVQGATARAEKGKRLGKAVLQVVA